MGLLDQMKEDKAKLDEMLEKGIVEDEEELIEEPQEEAEESESQDEGVIEEPEAPQEEPKAEEKPLEGKDYARMRRERREARKAELEEQERQRQVAIQPIQETQERVSVQEDNDPMPDKVTQYPLYLEWETRQAQKKAQKAIDMVEKIQKKEEEDARINAAVEHFVSIENDFKRIEPKYDEAAEFYTKQLAVGLKALHPTDSREQLAERLKMAVLKKAALYYSQGRNPAEELFEEAVMLGFNPDDVEEAPAKEVKPSMDKLARNRERNAGMNASGSPSRRPTMSVAANMTTGEWMKLSKAEKDAILKGK